MYEYNKKILNRKLTTVIPNLIVICVTVVVMQPPRNVKIKIKHRFLLMTVRCSGYIYMSKLNYITQKM